jgi:hypothetical protein
MPHHILTTPKAPIALFALAALLLAPVSACNSGTKATPENFTKTINSYFLDHPDCLLANIHFPYETSDKDSTKQMDTLVKANMLAKSEEMSIHASRYTPTDAGARYAPRFCFGHREVTNIDSFTPPAVSNGYNHTTVIYHYEMKEVPVWAKSPDVIAAFPALAQATSGQASGKIVLGETPAGWQVPE